MNPRPIIPASTSVTAFVSADFDGPKLQPVHVTSIDEARRAVGDSAGLELFFANGGDDAWLVRADEPADGLKALDAVDPINLLCLLGGIDFRTMPGAIEWCARRRAFFVSDAADPAIRGENVAGYGPDLILPDGTSISPSPAIAGLFARTDRTVGVWKAAAGTRATLAGVVAVEKLHALQPDRNVNQVRSLPLSGVVVWGARTRSDDPEWRYVPVRRLALFIEDSVRRSLQWVPFEPPTESLREEVQRAVQDFLHQLYAQGAFAGSKPEDSYLTRVDLEPERGVLNIEIGFAPLHPAEFVILFIALALQAEP